MSNAIFPTGIEVMGRTYTDTLEVQSGPLAKAEFDSGGRHKADYVQHRLCRSDVQITGADVVDRTAPIHIARAAGTIRGFRVRCDVVPNGGDKQFTVDLQKSTGGGAYATVLSAPVTLDDGNADRDTEVGTLASTTYVAGDVFRVVWDASGTTGTQGNTAIAQADFDENGA